jgi:malonyl CoA-acyl carrier protein transacylase
MLYAHGLDAYTWLVSPSSRPPVPYLASCAASLPLIGLTQIAQYIVCGRALGLSPAQMRARFAGGTGHSQGVVTACVIARDDAKDWEGFVETALVGLRLLFYIGLRGSEAFPPQALSPTTVQKCVDSNEGVPTPMLSVTGLSHSALQKHIDTANGHLEANNAGKVAISLYNGHRAFVVTGPPASLAGLASGLRKVKADDKDREQARTPHSKRKPVFTIRFLPIGVPYHSDYLASCSDRVVGEDLAEDEAFWDRSRLSFAIWHTEDGHDLRQNPRDVSLLRELCDQIFVNHIHWQQAARFPTPEGEGAPPTTHAVDFGPGGPSGVVSFTQRNLEGRGIRVVVASGGTTGRGAEEFYATRNLVRDQPWIDEYGSKLVHAGGRIHIDNRFTRLLGKPPLMVPGMTPSTVGAGFVAAVLNAGYHIELAGGGHYNEKALRAKVAEIQSRLETPGLALTLNVRRVRLTWKGR